MRIAVVGDVLLDADLDGRAERLSPDAPVPVLSVDGAVERPGGAGLVAALLARDGVEVTLVTALSTDDRANDLRTALERAGRDVDGSIELVAGVSPSPTPVKTRVRAGGHAVVRFDQGCDPAGPPEVTDAMLAALEGVGEGAVDGVLVADYGRGLVADERLRAALAAAATRVPVVWDPHPKGEQPAAQVTVVTPNLSEARAATGVAGDGIAAASEAAALLVEGWHVGAVLVTLAERGALLHTAGGTSAVPHVVPAVPVASADPCGAGDRLAATLVSELAAGVPMAAAVQAAVISAGRFLAAGGVATLQHRDPTAALSGEIDALDVARSTRARGGTVVATGGCFDLLHAGHARTLAAARSLGDCLIVCLNSDDSVRRLKGSERPIMTEQDRTDLLLALECVDAVIVFAESTPEAVLRRLAPDVWVKGGDYVAEDLPETAVLAEWGGRTVTVPYHPGRSTTALAGALARVG